MSQSPSDPRIISLIASATEILCALGLRDKMVGRSHECDYPANILDLPVCTAPKFSTDGSSKTIDEQLRKILQESLSVYRVDADLLDKLAPTHIITQTQCEVCAVSLKDVEDAAAKLVKSKPQIISLQPNCLADIYDDIKRVGTALGAEAEAQALIDKISAVAEDIRSKTAGVERPGVALIEWVDPLMPAANWMPELVRIAGGKNLFGDEGERSQVMPWKQLADSKPDVLIVSPCGFSMTQTLIEMPNLRNKKGWDSLSCVSNKRVYIVDGNQYFNRPGPRVLESLQIMAEILHPDKFNFGFENKAWQHYEGDDDDW